LVNINCIIKVIDVIFLDKRCKICMTYVIAFARACLCLESIFHCMLVEWTCIVSGLVNTEYSYLEIWCTTGRKACRLYKWRHIHLILAHIYFRKRSNSNSHLHWQYSSADLELAPTSSSPTWIHNQHHLHQCIYKRSNKWITCCVSSL
jgi:hypothetical protein